MRDTRSTYTLWADAQMVGEFLPVNISHGRNVLDKELAPMLLLLDVPDDTRDFKEEYRPGALETNRVEVDSAHVLAGRAASAPRTMGLEK